MHIHRIDKDSIEFTYKEVLSEQTVTSFSIKLTPNDLVVMQKMLEVFFSLSPETIHSLP